MESISWLSRRIRKIQCPTTFYSKSSAIMLTIVTIFSVLQTNFLRFMPTIIAWKQKEQRRFRCRNELQMTHLTSFYDVDCENSFLKELVNSTDPATKADVCNSSKPLYTRIMIDFRAFKNFQVTDFSELLKACPECHHLQVMDGKLHVVSRSTSSDYETRSRSVKTLFKYVIDTFDGKPNIEFLFHVGDLINMRRNTTHPLKCSVFGFAKNKNDVANVEYTDGVVSIPCFSFWSWNEARITRWDQKMISIKQAGSRNTFDKRTSKVFWRGANTGHRSVFVSLTEKHREIMDVAFMDWRGTGYLRLSMHKEYRTLEEHCDYKYLLHLEGNTFSGRLKYLLLCGSPVIFVKLNGWEEFWYHLLQHQENILLLEKSDDVLLMNTTKYLLENPERASRIGINGQNTVLKYLNEQAIICYMRNVLLAYSRLIDYQVTKRDHATDFFSNWTMKNGLSLGKRWIFLCIEKNISDNCARTKHVSLAITVYERRTMRP